MGKKDIKIVVATHKEYKMPKDEMYLPLEVGAACRDIHTGFQRDDTGENISKKNPGFCELTGLYWAWKNLDNDYIGLVHYRRYFAASWFAKVFRRKDKRILSLEQASNILTGVDIVLPRQRNYLIEDLYSHYAHTMYEEPLMMLGEVLQKKYPKYFQEYEALHKRKKAHMFNMLIMKKGVFDNYCDWLFDVLMNVEKKAFEKKLNYDTFHSRFYGRLSELMLDIYIRTNDLTYKEIPFFSTEPVNWFKKGKSFVAAKIFGRKYDASF